MRRSRRRTGWRFASYIKPAHASLERSVICDDILSAGRELRLVTSTAHIHFSGKELGLRLRTAAGARAPSNLDPARLLARNALLRTLSRITFLLRCFM